MASAYLFIAHGSREEGGNADFLNLVKGLSKEFREGFVMGAFLELARPLISEGLDACAAATREGGDVYAIPLMLFRGRHVQRDIPRLLEEARARHPRVRFHDAGPLADSPEFPRFLSAHVASLQKKDKQTT